jgi:uncharacterized protein YecE (DUF72 family)
MQCQADRPTGYAPEVLDAWAACAQAWAEGREPAGVPKVEGDPVAHDGRPRDVFLFMINGAKERAPAAAKEVLARLGG